MKNHITIGTLFLLISLFTSCLKDSPTPERRGYIAPGTTTGQAAFWLSSSNGNTTGQNYQTPITIYNSDGTVYIAQQTYDNICGGSSFPGCSSSYGKVFTLPTGSYYAKIVYASPNQNYQSSIFTVTDGGCTAFN